MAGTVVQTATIHDSVKKVKFQWTSTAAGNASATTSAAYDGQIVQVVTSPGTAVPAASCDVAIKNSDGVDVLFGLGVNRSSTLTVAILASSGLGYVSDETLNFVISNAGNAKSGTCYVYVR